MNQAYLLPTSVVDSDHPSVVRFAQDAAKGAKDPAEAARRIFTATRDSIAYDPYTPFFLPEHYRASHTLEAGRGYCVIKAVLLCAAGRALGIGSRLCFVTIRNHGAPAEIKEALGTDLFVWHGYVEFWLNGKWVKATPAFDAPICEKHDIALLEFDGENDCVFPAVNRAGKPYVEYVERYGCFADLPLERLLAGWDAVYGAERVRLWIQAFEKGEASRWKDAAQR